MIFNRAEQPAPDVPPEGDEPLAEGDDGIGDGDTPIDTTNADLNALNDRYLRLAAEYDNFRKRTDRERGDSWLRAQAEVVRALLEPLDDLQRVADYTVDQTSVEALLEGVQMVERKLLRALETSGLELMDARGQKFDPEMHEALMTAATDDPAEDDTVGDVFQPGYRFKGLLLRPARVQVRKHGG
jgi:molecular chaperone GrpE